LSVRLDSDERLGLSPLGVARLLAAGPRRVEETRLRFHRFRKLLIRSIEIRYGTISAIPTYQSPQSVIY
jgi:hypothetical protein